jgi:hypothetical protein
MPLEFDLLAQAAMMGFAPTGAGHHSHDYLAAWHLFGSCRKANLAEHRLCEDHELPE